MVPVPSVDEEWESIRQWTLLSATELQNMAESATQQDGLLDVYQTETEKGERRIWWVDGQRIGRWSFARRQNSMT